MRPMKSRKSIQIISLKGNRRSFERQLTATGRQIGKLVYELYGLTADEIKIVEEGAG